MTHLQFKTKPYRFQLDTLETTKDYEFHGWIFDPGLGKSKMACDQAAYLFNDGKITQLLYITKNGVDEQFINEAVPQHLPLLEEQFVTDCWHETGAWRKLDKWRLQKANLSKKLLIAAINCEALQTKKGFAACEKLARSGPTMLVVDESQEFSGLSATRTVNLLKIAPLFKYRRLSTGTLTGGNPLHAYPQLRILSPSLMPMDRWSFEYKYCVKEKQDIWIKQREDGWVKDASGRSVFVPAGSPVRKKVDVIKGYRNLEQLQAVIAKCATIKTKDECPDLPPKIYKKVTFELNEQERKLYNKVKSSVLSELAPGKYISAEMAVTKLIRLQQIACGFTVFEDLVTGERGKHLLEEPTRIKRLLETCSQIQGKTLIWSRFTTSTEQIVAELRKVYGEKAVVQYDGTVSSADKHENKMAFKEDPNVRFFCGNPRAGGVGLDLPEATYCIYYSNDHSLISRLQSEDRCHRVISRLPVTYIDMVANKTVDDKILTALRSRFDIASQLTGENLRKWIT